MSIVKATPGGSDSNSYVSLEEANAYFNTRLNSDPWDSAPEISREKALIMATSILESLDFAGSKSSNSAPGAPDYQALQWPRRPEFSDPYLLGIPHLMTTSVKENEWIDSSGKAIIPLAVKHACCEQAFFLIRAIKGLDKREHLKGQGINSVSYPNINEAFVNNTPIAPAAFRFLNKVNAVKSSVRIVRG